MRPAIRSQPSSATRAAWPSPHQQRLEVVTADVLDPASISPAVTGADAILTAVGPQGTGPSTLRQDSARSIIQAMQETGARRLLAVSGSIVADEGESPYLRYLLKPLVRRTFLRNVCADLRGTEDEIHASDLDWTIFRPPTLTNKPARGTYRAAAGRNLPHCFNISRANLVACMLSLLDDRATVDKHICIAN